MGASGTSDPRRTVSSDFLAAAKQRLWQVLPLSPTGYGSSPYSALSAFAGNPLLISLECLVERWLDRRRSASRRLPGHEGPCDFDTAYDKDSSDRRGRGQLSRSRRAGGRAPLPALLPGEIVLAHGLRHVQRPAPPLQLPELERVAGRVRQPQARRHHRAS